MVEKHQTGKMVILLPAKVVIADFPTLIIFSEKPI